MALQTYISERMEYSKPQALLLCDGYSTASGFYIPDGVEYTDFIILSDHSRSDIDVSQERIENRKRMIHGRMRSYWIADKITIKTSWEMLPSRAFDQTPAFDPDTGQQTTPDIITYTVDGGAGGLEMLQWYNSHTGSFYALLAYDGGNMYGRTDRYVKVVKVFIADFSHAVVRRGETDFWDVSLALEEA